MGPLRGRTADNVVFYSTVDKNYGLVAVAVVFDLFAACLGHEVLAVGVVEVNIGGSLRNYFSEHRSFFAQMLG